MEYTVKLAVGLKNNPDAIPLRETVFQKEQGFTTEFDAIDENALHLVLYCDGIPAATGRLYQDETGCHIGRVAVAKSYRGQHLGALVLEILEDAARHRHCDTISLSAQVQAQSFYEKQGYHSLNDLHMDEFCPHVTMVKTV
ncbi:MAG: GNAT family N-acetyltransferase [Oscillospiraceae bacterium]|nr:GNAT family N-acetyltransferase [Oscillospiraceae bacterium]